MRPSAAVSILDDDDHVSGDKVRFSSDATPLDHQVVAGVAMQLFGLGIPCIYYGTEQAFAGPEKPRRRYLPDYNGGKDKYLREAMFGPDHPRASGRAGIGNPLPTSISVCRALVRSARAASIVSMTIRQRMSESRS